MQRYLSDKLPWCGIFAPGVGFLKDGSWIATFKLVGHDHDSVTPGELGAVLDYLNTIITDLGAGYGIFFEARRRPASQYPAWTGDFDIPFLADEERRMLFDSGMYWETDYYLSFTWMPSFPWIERLKQWIFADKEKTEQGTYEEQVADFSREMETLVSTLRRCFPTTEWLRNPDDIVTYWGSTLRPEWHQIDAPEVLYNLDRYVGQVSLQGGLKPILGGQHLRIIRVETWPAGVEPGVMDVLHHIPFPFRYAVRYLPLGKTEALREMKRAKQRWSMRSKTLAQYAKEGMSAKETEGKDVDLAAADMAQDMQLATRSVQLGEVGMGYLTMNVQVWGETELEADDRAATVKSALHAAHFGAETETMNAIQAWFGSLPGEHFANVRRPLVTSRALTRLALTTSVWGGPDGDEHWGGIPLLVGEGTGASPFRFSLHVGDVGHVAVIGPTGGGKSTLLTMMALQAMRYPDLNVFVFDKGQAFRPLVTLLGGTWCNIGAAKSVGGITLQPLRYIDQIEEREWADQWLRNLIFPMLAEPTPSQRKDIWDAIGELAALPEEYRTLTGLTHLCQDEEVIAALIPFTAKGATGALFDSNEETLEINKYAAMECETLFKRPELIFPTLGVAVHRIDRLLQSENPPPTLMMMFEAWKFISDMAFAPQVEEWLRELRKKNVSLIMEFTSLKDVAEHPMGAVILESCKTKIYLPNPEAKAPKTREYYQKAGLGEQQIDLIATSIEKRDYYYTSPMGTRLFRLNLEANPTAAALCTRGSIADLSAFEHLQKKLGSDDLAPAWFEHCGLPDVAEILRQTRAHVRTPEPRPSPSQLALLGR